jgi:chromosome segregation ATPase
VRATHESQIEILEMKIKRLEGDLAEAGKRIKEKEQTLAEREVIITQRDTRIKELEKEI